MNEDFSALKQDIQNILAKGYKPSDIKDFIEQELGSKDIAKGINGTCSWTISKE